MNNNFANPDGSVSYKNREANQSQAEQIAIFESEVTFRVFALFALLNDQLTGLDMMRSQANMPLVKYDLGGLINKLNDLRAEYQRQFEKGRIKNDMI